MRDIGWAAADLLLADGGAVRHVSFVPELVVRESSHAELFLVQSGINLYENIHRKTVLSRTLVDFFREFEAVHGMNHGHLVYYVLDLVGLQMTDQMPFYGLYIVKFIDDFLYLVLAYIGDPRVYRFIDLRRSVKFRHRNEKYIFSASSRLFGGRRLQTDWVLV